MSRHGENIRKRKDGRWEGRYVYKQSEDSKAVMRSVYATSYSNVKEKLLLARQEKFGYSQSTVPDMPSFDEIAAEWLQNVRQTKKYSTYIKYRSIYERYINPPLKELNLATSSADMIKCSVSAHFHEIYTMSSTTDSLEKSIYCVVNQILTFGSERYGVSISPIKKSGSRTKKYPVAIFNISEQKKLMEFLYQDMDLYKLGIVICLHTGLRLGELCSLKWSDIDMENRILHVSSTIQRLPVSTVISQYPKTMLLETDPKSLCSKREIPLNDKLYAVLTDFRHSEIYVIGKNKPIDPRTYQKKFSKYLSDLQIPYRSFHTLRHTFASNCIACGADAKSLSEILGHSGVEITLNRYVHPTITMKKTFLNKMSQDIEGQMKG